MSPLSVENIEDILNELPNIPALPGGEENSKQQYLKHIQNKEFKNDTNALGNLEFLREKGLSPEYYEYFKQEILREEAGVQTQMNFKETCTRISNNNISTEELKSFLSQQDESFIEKVVKETKNASKKELLKIRDYNHVGNERHTTEWEKLEITKGSEYTDIFFLGVPSAGKSCILASFFKYCNDEGCLDDVIRDNERQGWQYKTKLIEDISNGFLPHSTVGFEQGKVIMNYMTLGLRTYDEKKHKDIIEAMEQEDFEYKWLNCVEMGGELLERAVEDGLSSKEKNKKKEAIRWVKNKNRKIFFLVIDYEVHINNGNVEKQKAALSRIIADMESANIFNRTNSIAVLLTKSDKHPGGELKKEEAEDFVKKNYKQLWTQLIRIEKDILNNYRKNDWGKSSKKKLQIIPSSIGEVKWNKYLSKENLTTAEEIKKFIGQFTVIDDTKSKRKGGIGSAIRQIIFGE